MKPTKKSFETCDPTSKHIFVQKRDKNEQS